MYTKILVPFDGSALASAVLPHVREVARCTHAGVVLLRVVPDPGLGLDGLAQTQLERQETIRDSDLLPSVAERDEKEDFLRASRFNAPDVIEREAEAYKFLDTIATDLEQSGIHTQTRVKIASPAEAILDVAAEEGVDLIAMSTHGRSGIGRFLLGSVADRVVHHVNVPVLLVRSLDVGDQKPEEPVTYKKILIPLDGSELANEVLSYARDLALCADAKVVLLRVIPPPAPLIVEAEAKFMLGGRMPEDVAETGESVAAYHAKSIEYAQVVAQGYLDAKAADLRKAGLQVDTMVQNGEPAETILDLAGSSHADMIAMATHGLSGIRRFLMGSVADRVVRHAQVPVLLVRPGLS